MLPAVLREYRTARERRTNAAPANDAGRPPTLPRTPATACGRSARETICGSSCVVEDYFRIEEGLRARGHRPGWSAEQRDHWRVGAIWPPARSAMTCSPPAGLASHRQIDGSLGHPLRAHRHLWRPPPEPKPTGLLAWEERTVGIALPRRRVEAIRPTATTDYVGRRDLVHVFVVCEPLKRGDTLGGAWTSPPAGITAVSIAPCERGH